MFRVNNSRPGRWGRCAMLAAAVAFAAATAVWGQHQVDTGRRLDNNLQQGSGGLNARSEPNPYGRYSDAIITGNVGGLGAFRDRVGYGAAGEFRDATSADSTYGFRRSALPQGVERQAEGPARPSSRNPQIDPARVQGTVLFRGGAGTRVDDLTRQVRQYPQSFVIDDPSDASGRALLAEQPLDDRIDGRLTETRSAAGLLADESGQLLQVTTSPLTGLRREVIGRLRPDEIDEEDGEEGELDLEEQERRDREARESARRRGQVDAALSRRGVQAPPRLQGRVEGVVVDSAGQALARLDGADEVEAGEDAYVDLLRRIEERTVNAPLGPGSRQRRLDEDQELSRVDELAERFERTQRGEFDEEAAEGEPIDRLAKGLTYDLPPVDTFVGSGETPTNRLLAEAERHMQAGRYFQAEAMYDRVQAMRPDYAIAGIGRVHAQLGAGLYVSAATALRHVLATHPHLIAARYTGAVMPDASRLETIDQQLENLADSEPGAAALLQSYLAYQRGNMAEMDEALERLEQETAERDALPELLRQIWTRDAEE